MKLLFGPIVVSSLFALTVMATGIDNMITELVDSHAPLLNYPTNLTQGIIPKPIHCELFFTARRTSLTALNSAQRL